MVLFLDEGEKKKVARRGGRALIEEKVGKSGSEARI